METIYKLYDLRKYYPSFVGANPIAVVSSLPKEELMLHFPELNCKAPFTFFTTDQWRGVIAAFRDYDLNEKKYQMQALRHEAPFEYRDGLTELYMTGMNENEVIDEILNKIAIEEMRVYLNALPESQHRRLLLHFSGYSYAEIASQEQISKVSVLRSIQKGIKNLQRNMMNLEKGG